MNTYTDKASESKTQQSVNQAAQKSNSHEPIFQPADNRPEALAQRKLQESIHNSSRVQQFNGYQEIINNSPRVKQFRNYQLRADFTSPAAQNKENSGEEALQGKPEPIQKKENRTGLPDDLKAGIENLSGFSMDDVIVHRNSDKPAQLQAHAYAQGTDIHLAAGQEKHLPHEAWHVVQQKQGRVKPTLQMKGGVNVNDDTELEREADVLGEKSLQLHAISTLKDPAYNSNAMHIVQAMFRSKTGTKTKINSHNEQILKDALEALLEVQQQTVSDIGSFAQIVSDLADYVALNGFDLQAVEDLEDLYSSLAEVSFKSNPVLNEAWTRCLDSTRTAASKSIYSKVGGKFNKKFEEVLSEISTGYPALHKIVVAILTCDVNKEHMINKGLGGLQTAKQNLMDAGVGEKHTGGSGTLSRLHKELHRLKSGGDSYDYKTMDLTFETVVTNIQSGYDSDDMGALQ